MIPSANRDNRDSEPPEQVQEAEDVVAELVAGGLDRVDVDARRRDVRAQSVEQEDRRGEGGCAGSPGR